MSAGMPGHTGQCTFWEYRPLGDSISRQIVQLLLILGTLFLLDIVTTEIILWIGKNSALVNTKLVPIDRQDQSLSPMIREGRTFLPLRFVSENIGFKVEWNAKLYQVTLTFPSVDLPMGIR